LVELRFRPKRLVETLQRFVHVPNLKGFRSDLTRFARLRRQAHLPGPNDP
jgi:hypothetical protein